MLRGASLHAAGNTVQALAAFEAALALSPQDVDVASACATLLTELDRPHAAYRTLLSVEALLMDDADGAANLAIAAETCGELEKAQACYVRALALDPAHLRSLNNVGILAASSGQWDAAIALARQCLALGPLHAPHHVNLCEFLAGARRYPEALQVAVAAIEKFPQWPDLRMRHIALLAFNGALAQADAELESLSPQAREAFDEFLLRLEPREERQDYLVRTRNNPATPADALEIFSGQAFRDFAICDWRNAAKTAEILRQGLADAGNKGENRDWHRTAFFGQMLGLTESELALMQRQSIAANQTRTKTMLPPFAASPRHTKDSRIRVGLALNSLLDERLFEALHQQLAHHDASRFALHIYAFTAQPDYLKADQLRTLAASVSELAHMSDVEAVARIRLDQLDVYVELVFEEPFRRPTIAAMRVAPAQMQHPGSQRQASPGWDHVISDRFVHTKAAVPATDGATVRIAETGWLTAGGHMLVVPRQAVSNGGLPLDALVLCASAPAPLVDARSFAAWMKILRALPDAVLWLPFCGRAAHNLVREAQAAGVGAERLVFSHSAGRVAFQEALSQASLYLDTFGVSSASGLEDALRAGVLAISCAGDTMASRLGGSILRAAGLPDCVLTDPQAYVAEAIRLGRNPDALAALRSRVQAARVGSALFDLASRIRDWESAWTVMVERSRTGLPPTAFDVAAFEGTCMLLNT